MYLLGSAVARDQFRKDDGGNILGALVVNGDCLLPAREPVDHRENRLGSNADGNQDLTADDVDVQRRKWLVGGQASEGGAGISVSVPFSFTNITITYVSGDVVT